MDSDDESTSSSGSSSSGNSMDDFNWIDDPNFYEDWDGVVRPVTEQSVGDEVLQKLASNDPGFDELLIGGRCLPRGDEWGRLGALIGSNTHLKEISFRSGYGLRCLEHQFIEFFLGVAKNRSIETLCFNGVDLFGGGIFRVMAEFFKNNGKFESLNICGCDPNPECLYCLAESLSGCDSLKEFYFHASDYDRLHADLTEVVCALCSHSGLEKLSLIGSRLSCRLGKKRAALASLLKKTELAELKLCGEGIDDVDATNLASSLGISCSLKDLDLGENPNITKIGWQAIFSSLANTKYSLVTLSVSDICNDVVTSLSAALSNNRSLKKLTLVNSDAITLRGWQALFHTHHSQLESLELSRNGISDYVANALAYTLVDNSKLKELRLSGNRLVSPTALWTVLQSPHSALKRLDLRSNRINEGAMTSLANCLSNNDKLEELLLDSKYDSIRFSRKDNGWAAFEQLLCDKSSIMATYNSNHTLKKLVDFEELPGDLWEFLDFNNENSKSQAAQLKIIAYHFSEGFTTEPFIDMERTVLPHGLSWMGIGEKKNTTNTFFYNFVRSVPNLFEVVMSSTHPRKKMRC